MNWVKFADLTFVTLQWLILFIYVHTTMVS